MVHVTERAKKVLLEIRRSANIDDPDTSLRLARSSGRRLALVADRMKAGDQIVKNKDATVLLVDAELSELILAGLTVDSAQTGGRADLVLISPTNENPL